MKRLFFARSFVFGENILLLPHGMTIEKKKEQAVSRQPVSV